MERVLNILAPVLTPLGQRILAAVGELGRWCAFVGQTLEWLVRR